MYQALLTRRYLTRRIMPMLAIVAVMLCTAMVLIVWSVMAGFLDMLLGSGRALMGDALIQWPVSGIVQYEKLVSLLEDDPLIEAASPTLEAPGLIALPEPGGTRVVQVIGVDGPSYTRVTKFEDLLWWRHLDTPDRRDPEELDLRLQAPDSLVQQGAALTEPDPKTGEPRAAMVPGVWVSGFNRDRGGWIEARYKFLPQEEATLSVLPLSQNGAVIDVQARRFPIANEFESGLYDVDSGTVLVRLDALQAMLRMDKAQRIEDDFDFYAVNEDGGDGESFAEPVAVDEDPARVTSVLMRGAKGVTPAQVRDEARIVYTAFAEQVDEAPDPAFIQIYTWAERPSVRTFVSAVKHETALVLTLFGFISLTAAFLVLAIFWAMVSEKTKDIGVLRSLGAGRTGVAWIFLRFGMVIGVTGSALGGTVAFLIVTNINPIHEWIGQTFGVYVWDPEVYHFAMIPNDVTPMRAAIVLVGGVLFSLVGAAAPAIRAARLDPVRALRFE